MLAGIRDILVITTPDDAPLFRALLGDGSQWGIALSYAVQPQPDGLAQAFLIGARLPRRRGLRAHPRRQYLLRRRAHRDDAALGRAPRTAPRIFGYRVGDPERYGVVEFDAAGKALSIEEKPAQPRSNWAVIGLYFYDGEVVKHRRRAASPRRAASSRSPTSTTPICAPARSHVERLGRGYAWLDTGTHESLLEASEFVRTLEKRTGTEDRLRRGDRLPPGLYRRGPTQAAGGGSRRLRLRPLPGAPRRRARLAPGNPTGV